MNWQIINSILLFMTKWSPLTKPSLLFFSNTMLRNCQTPTVAYCSYSYVMSSETNLWFWVINVKLIMTLLVTRVGEGAFKKLLRSSYLPPISRFFSYLIFYVENSPPPHSHYGLSCTSKYNNLPNNLVLLCFPEGLCWKRCSAETHFPLWHPIQGWKHLQNHL